MIKKTFMAQVPDTDAVAQAAQAAQDAITDDFAEVFLDSAVGLAPAPGKTTASGSAAGVINSGSIRNAGAGRGYVNPSYRETPNIYQHKKDSDAAAVSRESAAELRAAFVPNILDNYDAVTYHWKLFITDPESSANGEILNPANQTIIAETGVTDLTIDKVEIGGVVTPSVESGTGVSTTIKFEIVEPSGAGLLDKIFYEAISLGIGNWAVMPMYIQLEFRARDLTTSNSLSSSVKTEINTLKWVWPIKITDTKAHITHVGTRYEFSSIPYSELTQSNINFVLQHNVKLENISTFSDAIKELEDKLNIDQLVKLTNNYSIPDLYEFHIDPELFNHTLATGNNQDSTRANSMDNLTLKDATFNSGTSIDKVIDNLLAHTQQYQKEFLGAKAPGAEGSPATETPAMKKFWRVITDARPLRFDPRRQDDAKIFTVYIVKYDIGTADSNVFQQSNSKNYQEVERRRLMTYVKNKILKKKYNYIFTGLNDQIHNLDLKLNNAYAVAMSRMSGIYSNLAMSDDGVVTHDNAKKESEITAKISSAIALQNSSRYNDSAKAKSAIEDARRAIEASTIDADTKKKWQEILEQARPGSRLEFQKKIIANGGISTDGTLNRYAPQSLASVVADTDYKFVSDVDLLDPKAKTRYNEFLASTKGKLRPIARVETSQDKQIGIGVESASNSGIQKLSSMYSVALQGFDTGFINVRMQIKGDPFWLFPAPIANDSDRPIYLSLLEPSAAIKWIKSAHTEKDSTVNYFSTDNFIVIRFRTPRLYAEDDAALNISNDTYDEVNLLSGVYRVTTVVSKFENGRFVQDLNCVIDPEIDLRNFVKEIEDVIRTPDVPATVDDIVNPLPETAVRQARISSLLKETGIAEMPSTTNIGTLLPGNSLPGINIKRFS